MQPHPPSIHFHQHPAGSFHLQAHQEVLATPETVFDFFSRPENLQRLTPGHLHFHILTPGPLVMADGLLLDYKLRLHGIPLRWRSRIEHWNPPLSFVDRQLRGPYLEWIHLHSFHPTGKGTRIEDHIRYRVPGGRLAEMLFVRPSLRRIFAHRLRILSHIFPGDSGK